MNQQQARAYVDLINGLHKSWKPHAGQIRVGKALLNDGVRSIFLQCARKWGKTELIIYLLWRWAQSNPGSSCYYISPFFKQSKEIVWANQRLQTFGPSEWLTSVNNTELRLNFKNGSFIKLDGSENYDAYRGIEPHFMAYEEFAQFRPEFHVAMEPNLAVFKAPLLIIGTPPDRECEYLRMAEEFKNNPAKRWFRAPTWENPHISKEWLEEKKQELIAKGEFDVWQREYEAIYVPGGVAKIFPMLSRDHVRPHNEIMREIERDKKKLHWFCVADPAAATVFAVLFAALNPYTKQWYFLDEIYETDQAKMTVEQIGRRIKQTKLELNPNVEWEQVYDEAEKWFAAEMWDRFQEHYVPTHKALNDKESGLSLFKDVLLNNKVKVSSRCEKFFWEADNYYKDKNGKIPKVNDHLLDTCRYLLAHANYSLVQEREPKETDNENFRGATISDDFPGLDDFGRRTNDEWSVGSLWRS